MIVPKVQDRKSLPQTESYELDDGTFVPFCTTFNYLGSTITCDLDDTTEIERRLSHAQMAFNTLWKYFVIDVSVSTAAPALPDVRLKCTSQASTLGPSNSHLQRLPSFDNSCTRTMCGIIFGTFICTTFPQKAS